MPSGPTGAIIMLITNDVLMYITLPLHARLLYVMLKPKSKKDLDPSFHMILINTITVDLLAALDACLILEPSYAGVFFEFYEMMGPYFAKIDLIKGSVLGNITSVLHVVLAINRFSAIAFPLKHKTWWSGRRLFWFCVVVWCAGFGLSIPLILPGSTMHRTRTNIYGVLSVDFILVGDYTDIYSLGCGFAGMGLELTSLLFYMGTFIKVHDYSKTSTASTTDMKRMKRGVLRMTLAAFTISIGHWLLVIFGLMIYISMWTNNGIPILYGIFFTATQRILNAVCNVLTPWVMLIAFNNIRFLVFGSSKSCQSQSTTFVSSTSGTVARNKF